MQAPHLPEKHGAVTCLDSSDHALLESCLSVVSVCS